MTPCLASCLLKSSENPFCCCLLKFTYASCLLLLLGGDVRREGRRDGGAEGGREGRKEGMESLVGNFFPRCIHNVLFAGVESCHSLSVNLSNRRVASAHSVIQEGKNVNIPSRNFSISLAFGLSCNTSPCALSMEIVVVGDTTGAEGLMSELLSSLHHHHHHELGCGDVEWCRRREDVY